MDKKMKIAIFHNFMDNIGGAEMVALALARGLDADIYTTSLDPEKIKAMGYDDVVSRITSVGSVPKTAPFRQQLALWKMRRIDANRLLRKRDPAAAPYDFFIIAGDWAVGAAVNNAPNLWYIHSPLNELWHFQKWIRQTLLVAWKRPLFDVFTIFNRWLTRRYSKHVRIWVTNSRNVQARTKKYYDHDSIVINPPVDMSRSEALPSKGYWLAVNRLFNHKRIEIQMKALKLIHDEKLVIVGSYEKGAAQFESYKAYMESIQPGNVEIRHWVDAADLRKLYAECKGFITTAKDEDFGLTPIEAMACGKPVIAANEGGYTETVIDGKTGVLVNFTDAPATEDSVSEANGRKLADAIMSMSAELHLNPDMYKEACLARAREFDVSVFIEKIRAQIDAYMRNHQHGQKGRPDKK